jgi:hypothetical protein
MKDIVYTHPSNGLIQISRCNGIVRDLFGSDLDKHENYIEIKIYEAEEYFHLNQKWFHQRKPITTIAMSEAQFATLITTLNNGGGVPCTLRYANGKIIESDKNRITESNLIQDILPEEFKLIKDSLEESKQTVKDILEKKTLTKEDKREILEQFSKISMNVLSNLPFIMDQFSRSIEKIKATAKADIDAWITNTLNKMGLTKVKELQQAQTSNLLEA